MEYNKRLIAAIICLFGFLLISHIALHDSSSQLSPQYYPAHSRMSSTIRNATDGKSRHCDHKQAERKRAINKVCTYLNVSQKVAKGFQMVVDPEHRILYCEVPKAGCSTMLYMLEGATSVGKKLIHQHKEGTSTHNISYVKSMGLSLLNDYTASEQANIMSTYTKFLVVRHPISRLISAYWDKMTASSGYFHKISSSVIARQQHQNIKEQELMTFSSSSRHRRGVVREQELNVKTSSHSSAVAQPSFQEFVRARLDRKWRYRSDRHWRTQFSLCSPCSVKYDYILKLESMEADIELFVNALATNGTTLSYVRSLLGVRNKSRHKRRKRKSPPDVTLESTDIADESTDIADELRNLTSEEKERVIELYRLDMDVFGYDIDPDSARMHYDDLTECEAS